MEIFCPGRLAEFSRLFGLVHGGSFDLRTGWDLSDPQQQRRCSEAVDFYEPIFVLGSPQCAPFSNLQYLNPDTPESEAAYQVGLEHMRFVTVIYWKQISRGDVFLHEQPWTSAAWQLECISELMEEPSVEVRRGDQCVFGLVVPDAHGNRLAKKPTGWMSNCPEILGAICARCPNDSGRGPVHEHSTFVGRDMRAAERYPPKLLKAILAGLQRYVQQRP